MDSIKNGQPEFEFIRDNERAFTEFSYGLGRYLNVSWFDTLDDPLIKWIAKPNEFYTYDRLCELLNVSRTIKYQENINYSQLDRVCCYSHDYKNLLKRCLFPEGHKCKTSQEMVLTEREVWNQYHALSLKQRCRALCIEGEDISGIEHGQITTNIILLSIANLPEPVIQRIQLAFDPAMINQAKIFLANSEHKLGRVKLYTLQKVFLRLLNFIDRKRLAWKKND